MSVAPQEVLALAQELQSRGNEPAWRGAISRAYYAAFHHAKAWHGALPSPGSPREAMGGGMHHELVACLTAPTLPKDDPRCQLSMSAGYILRDSHKSRVKADYALSDNISSADANQAVASASRIISKLS